MATNVRLRILPALLPRDGRQIELQATPTYIQWRYVADFSGTYAWVDLIALSVLVGPEGPAVELRSDGTNIQYRVSGEGDDAWVNIAPLSDFTGPPGPQGPSVSDGDKGDAVVSSSGAVWRTARKFTTAALLLADTTMKYSAGLPTVSSGQIVEAQGFRYQVAASGASDHHVTTAGGVKLYVADSFVDPLMLGSVTGIVDTLIASAIAVAATLNVPLRLYGRTYNLTKQVDFSALVNGPGVDLGGPAVFDFRTATTLADFPLGGFVCVLGAALTTLPDMTTDRVKGHTQLAVPAHGLLAGDRFCIYNPTDYSWHGARDYYRAGEWCRVERVVSSGVIALFGGLYDSYTAASVDLYKHPNKPFRISGGTLTILESEAAALNNVYGFRAERIVDSNFSAIRPTNSGYAGLAILQCINIFGTGYDVRQSRFGGAGGYYGVLAGNCQDINMEGLFHAGRHAFVTGGGTIVGSVPCRNIRAVGRFTNSDNALTGTGAVNCHGNSEYVHFEGVMDGFSGGGDHVTVRGKIFSKAGQNGIAVLFSEMKGCNFDFTNVEIYSPDDPNTVGRGVIDMGGNSTGVLDANTTRGGTINLSGVVIDAPVTRRAIFIANRGYVGAEKIVVDLSRLRLKPTSGATPLICAVQTLSGNNIDTVIVANVANDAAATWSIPAATKIRGYRADGVATLTTTTAITTISAAVVLSPPAPKAPRVSVCLTAPNVGGMRCISYAGSPTTTGFTVGASTATAANFALANANDVNWCASLDEQ